MFNKKVTDKIFPRDFSVSYVGKEGSYVSVRVGPRYQQWEGPLVSADENGFHYMNTQSYKSTIDFSEFYTHTSSEFAWSFAQALKQQGKNLSELSRYLPVTEPDKTLAEVNEFIFVSEALGGTFRVPVGVKTYFWIKVPSRPSADFTKLETEWVRMEYGPSIPTNPGTRFDDLGNASYNTFIPIFSVTPDAEGLNEEEYELGELRYYNPLYYVVQNGKRRDVVFPYGKITTLPT